MDDLDWSIRFYIGVRAYGASKLAQLMTMHTLSGLLEGTGVTINAMHPGMVGSQHRQQQRPAVPRDHGRFARRFLLKSPAISGEALYYLAAAPELKQTTGRYFFLTADAVPMATALDETLRSGDLGKAFRIDGSDAGALTRRPPPFSP